MLPKPTVCNRSKKTFSRRYRIQCTARWVGQGAECCVPPSNAAASHHRGGSRLEQVLSVPQGGHRTLAQRERGHERCVSGQFQQKVSRLPVWVSQGVSEGCLRGARALKQARKSRALLFGICHTQIFPAPQRPDTFVVTMAELWGPAVPPGRNTVDTVT